jgi:hypothetical protein
MLIDRDRGLAERRRRRFGWMRIALGFVIVIGAADASAATRMVAPSGDTFINSVSPDGNNGASPSIFTGTDGHAGLMRGLVRFDLPSELQGRVTVTSVQLSMTVELLPNGTVGAAVETLQSLTQPWVQGNGVGGNGSFTTGQGCGGSIFGATWNQSSCAAGTNWVTPGGAVSATISGQVNTAGVPAGGVVVWDSAANPLMNADLQSWIDSPSSNFGWRISSSTEGTIAAAQRFFSTEAGASAPALTVTYSCKPGFVENGVQCVAPAVPAMSPWQVVLLALMLSALIVARRSVHERA